MGLGFFTLAGIFLVIWWVVLFMVLPFGMQSHAEAGLEVKDGGDPGAPVMPNLRKKVITTTIIAVAVWFVFFIAYGLNIIPLPDFPTGNSVR